MSFSEIRHEIGGCAGQDKFQDIADINSLTFSESIVKRDTLYWNLLRMSL